MLPWLFDIYNGISMFFLIVPQFLDMHHGIIMAFQTSTMVFWYGSMVVGNFPWY